MIGLFKWVGIINNDDYDDYKVSYHYTIDKVKIKFIEAFGGHRIPGVWDGQAESC